MDQTSAIKTESNTCELNSATDPDTFDEALRLTDPAVTTQSASPLTPNSAAPFGSALSACYRPSGCF